MAPKTSPGKFARLRRWIKKWRVAFLLALLGSGVVLTSLIPAPGLDAGWTRDLLLTVGTTLALFAPLYVMTRSLDGHLDEVQEEAKETRAQVENVRNEAAATSAEIRTNIETLRADVDARLTDFSERVRGALQAEDAANTAAFDSLRSDSPTLESVEEALRRARDRGLTRPGRPPRVDVSDRVGLSVGAEYDEDEWAGTLVVFTVEDTSGSEYARVPWEPALTADEVFIEVGRVILKQTNEVFDPSVFLSGLADLLDAATSQPERREAIELCDPQWMVCVDRVVTSGRDDVAPLYGLQVSQIAPDQNVSFVSDKNWIDFDSFDRARAIALQLFPQRPSSNPWAKPPAF